MSKSNSCPPRDVERDHDRITLARLKNMARYYQYLGRLDEAAHFREEYRIRSSACRQPS